MGVLKVWDGAAWQNISATSEGDAAVYVGPEAPSGMPAAGDMWWDTDETAPGLTTPLSVVNGGTGATSPATARTSLAVPSTGNSTITAGPPTGGTWARGDQWLDSANVVWTCTTGGTPGTWAPPSGYEYSYAQITVNTVINATTAATATTIFAGSAITYDGTPILIEVNIPAAIIPPVLNGGIYVHIWDGSTDMGASIIYSNPAASAHFEPGAFRRKVVPTAGSHTYSIRAWIPTGSAGSGSLQGGAGTPAALAPMSFRIVKA